LETIVLQKSAIILAGGFSRRFGRDKGLVLLKDKPLVLHVIDQVSPLVDSVLVVVSSKKQKKDFERILGNTINIVIDSYHSQTPLVGAITGFQSIKNGYSLLLPCDAPLISRNVISFLFDTSFDRQAVIPRWPSGYIEPLQAVYHTKSCLTAAKIALKQGCTNMRSMINNLHKVRYISTLVLKQLDDTLISFFNVNTPQDLEKANSFLN
jgi:molybdopterin-guanine dinucleotide biosynthesis protein A